MIVLASYAFLVIDTTEEIVDELLSIIERGFDDNGVLPYIISEKDEGLNSVCDGVSCNIQRRDKYTSYCESCGKTI